MPENYFDERVAVGYDAEAADRFAPELPQPEVDVLAELVGDGAALEFGVGTGRVALALARRGVHVEGIDSSAAMLAQLRQKPGADAVGVTEGDFAHIRVDGAFRLVYLVFNTINNVTTRDGQVDVFANAAAHLEPGGCFVVECGVPALRRLPPGESVQAFAVTPTHLGFDEFTDLTERQQFFSHHYRVAGDRMTMWSVPFRYVWPSELDLMARLAGMRLRARWANWAREPFTGDSSSHVSVWERPS